MYTVCTFKLVHFIGLAPIGGVQRLYSRFIHYKSAEFSLEHHTLLPTWDEDSPLLSTVREGSAAIHDLSRYRDIKIPKRPRFVKRYLRKRILDEIAADVSISWNSLSGIELLLVRPQTRVVYYEHGGTWLKRDDARMKERLGLVSRIVCNSHAAKRMIELKWGFVDPERMSVCLNPIVPECAPSYDPSKTLSGKGPIRLGCAGRLIPLKGFPVAIHAVAELKKRGLNCELRVAGTGRDLELLQSLGKRLGVEKEVQYLGFLPNMEAFFSDIDCLICPSIREPFGLVCAEAMAHGCPVVAGRVDGIPEVVTHLETGFCVTPTLPIEDYGKLGGTNDDLPEYVYDPVADRIATPRLLDPMSIADSVQALVRDPTLFSRMSRKARMVAREKFDFNRYAEDLLAVLVNA